FLADMRPDELRDCFRQLVAGNYRITSHLMFECVVGTDGEERTILGLNEVAFHAGPPYQLVDFDLSVDGEPVTRFSADGLIISTPIGSTAYNLSAGGPILGQELDAFVITPICPHTLTNRPVVDRADKVYTIAARTAEAGTSVVVDGQE